MTKKLIHIILTSCLLFSSLYFPAYAQTASKPLLKKSPEAQFSDGKTCLEQNNLACAKLNLALIPTASPYAKILEGALALQNKQADQALLALLPLQGDENLNASAKILLHQSLAQAFANIGDTQQAVQHFIRAEELLIQNQTHDAADQINKNHAQIWQLLQPLQQADLISLRGNNTDSVFQGWVDLALAAQHANSKLRVSEWRAIYADHPAQAFASNLSEKVAKTTPSSATLSPDSIIAIMATSQGEIDSEKFKAFKLGLETAANLANINTPIQIYHQEQTEPEEVVSANYFIIPKFAETDASARPADLASKPNIAGKPTLQIGIPLQDEANTMMAFARAHQMQYLTVVTTQHETAQQMLKYIQEAWVALMEPAGYANLRIITLDADVLAQPIKLLDLKSQIAADLHDMVILAMPAQDVVKIRPYLDISMPSITFSAIHDVAYEQEALKLLNALRFVEMPFLIESLPEYDAYRSAAATLTQKELLRWFAVGADSLQLLSLMPQNQNHAVLIKGLAGSYELTGTGEMSRSLSTARFNSNGAVAE